MRFAVVISALLIACTSTAQRLIRSHLIQASGGNTACALVVRDFDNFNDPMVDVFHFTNAIRVKPGDYFVGYFVDTDFVHQNWIHVSHQWSVSDDYIVIDRVRLSDLRFGKNIGDTTVVTIDILEP